MLTVVTQARNRDLTSTIRSLGWQGTDFYFILVDGGNNILPPDPVGAEDRRIVASPGDPYHWARLHNVGLRHTGTDLVLFLDADIILAPGTLLQLEWMFRRAPETLFLAERYDLPEGGDIACFDLSLPHTDRAYGAFMAMSAPTFKDMGGFDEDFKGLGVVDDHLVARWHNANRAVIYGAPIWHVWHGPDRCYDAVWEVYRDKVEHPQIEANHNREWGSTWPS